MAWRSTVITQNGNTTVDWTVGRGNSSTHDAVVVGPTSGNSRLRLERVDVSRGPTTYVMRVRVVGAGAMAFRFWAETMN